MKMEPAVDSYPLSPMQQGMLFHSLTAPQPGVDIEQIWCALHESVDAAALERAWQRVSERHDVLRITFHWEDGAEPRQQVHPFGKLRFEHSDWRGKSQAEQEALFEKALQTDRDLGFKLAQEPPSRVALFRMGESDYRLLWTFHHLLADGRAVVLVLKEVFACYEAFVQGQDLELPPAQPYHRFIDWLRHQDQSEAEAFWRQNLKGFSAPTSTGVGHSSSPESRSGEIFGEQGIGVSESVTAALKSVADGAGITINTCLQGAWAFLLSRYSGEEDVVFGAVRACRRSSLPEAASMVGLLINTIPVRVLVTPSLPVVAWLQRLRQTWTALRDFEQTPLVRLQQWSEVPRGQPMFETLFNFQEPSWDAALRAQGGAWATREFGIRSQSNYPLVVDAYGGSALFIKILYHRNRFEGETVARMLVHFKTLLEGMAANPGQTVGQLSMLSRAERQQLLMEWNDTAVDLPGDTCALQLFEEQAAGAPDALAVAEGDQQLTYGQLNEWAAQVARLLRGLGVGPNVRVGICLERSAEMIIALLAVWKAGGAYVPLDPAYPPQRLAFLLRDAHMPVVLTKSVWGDKFPTPLPGCRLLHLDALLDAALPEPLNALGGIARPRDLAYVIYTSGSTGTPKGVEIEHRSLMNLIAWHRRTYRVSRADRATQIASPAFDASVWELWPYLTAGASIHLPDEETRLSPARLADWLIANRITLTFIPTPLLERMLDLQWPQSGTLRTILTGGDKLHRAPGPNLPCALINHYGPTESTVVATWIPVPPSERSEKPPPIGRPIDNTQAYILDRQLQPVPIGVVGELHLGGLGLARGYLGRPDLTAEKFIKNPFGKDSADVLYKTGDLARWRPDGQIEFLGRLDHQVKLRGQRIELGEVESALSQHPAVRQALALVLEDVPREPRLVAWLVVRRPHHAPTARELRDFLKRKLPDAMVPAAFMTLESFPVTPNGKVDRNALPAPAVEAAAGFVAPRCPSEEMLAGIWCEVLGVRAAGVHDNFFELGGHSLLATQVLSRVRNAFGIELPLRSLFDAPTIESLARKIDLARHEPGKLSLPGLVPRRNDSARPLSFAQERLWFMEQMEPGLPVNNIPLALQLSGPLNPSGLERALNELARRHESFRTVFRNHNGRPEAAVKPPEPQKLPLFDLSGLPAGQSHIASRQIAALEARRPFDLAQGPLLRASLLRFAAEEHLLLLTTHHIACDGWSLGICYRELGALYAAFACGRSSPLAEPALQYADFAHWQRQRLAGGVQDEQSAFWKRQLEGATAVLDLPTERPRPAVQSYRGAIRTFEFPPALSAGLERLCLQEDVTLFMLLVATLQTLLHRYSGQEEILVGSPVAGRPCVETENLVGLFLNTLVLRGDCSGDPTFGEFLKRVRQVALDAYAHQELPFEKLVEALQPRRDLSRSPLFQVMFILQNEPLRPLELPGLRLKPVPTHSGTAKFDLLFSVEAAPGGLSGFVEYNTDLFNEAAIARMLAHFERLLESALANPGQRVSALPMLTESERRQLLVEWNNTGADFPREKCIHELIEEQATRNPDAVAIVFQDQQITYGELDRRAERVAAELRTLGLGPDVRAGLCLERSLELIVGLLGILKAGGCYVPLDPAYPKARLAFMLEDSGAPVLLTQRSLHDELKLELPGLKTLFLDSPPNPGADAKRGRKVHAEHLAYVLYTSGSTGQPKGVMVTHRNVVNFFAGMDALLGVKPGVWLAVTSISFDISVLELLWTLARGFKVVLQPEEIAFRDAARRPRVPVLGRNRSVAEQIGFHGVTHFQCTPSLAGVLALMPETLAALKSLDKLLLGGEALPTALARQLRPGLRGELINVYGPTETTVWSAAHRVNEIADTTPIGRPLANTRIYILDAHLQPVPVGIIGEIVIGGEGVARGYLGRPELTAEKFIPDPFSGAANARCYRTGDLGRFRADGTIEFLGRLDHQVKIRGHRIEPGEIEATLARHPAVREALVVAREDSPGEPRLVAYVVAPERTESAVLRRFLEDKLPEVMMPSAFVLLDKLPLTPNGKLDRRALPPPSSTRSSQETAYQAPESALETAIAEVWQQVLGVEKAGLNDNFFDLGGHSLLAVRAQVMLQERLKTPVAVLKLFQYPTIRALAGYLGRQGEPLPGRVSNRGRRKQAAFGLGRKLEETLPV